MLATHDAADGLDAVVVGDHHDARIEPVGAGIECQHLLALLRAADGEIALHLPCIEDVERPAAVESDVVGDVHQRIDRAKSDGEQTALHPFRGRAVLHAAHEAECKGRAELRVLDRH
jgi:hypothetical protein